MSPANETVQGHAGFLAVVAVATLANLTALALSAGSDSLPLIAVQGVGAGASGCAIALLLRRSGSVQAQGQEGQGKASQEKDTEHLPHDLLEDKRWLGLVEEMVALLDELEKHGSNFDPAARDLADHVNLRVEEVLERSGVTVIAGETVYDRNRHLPEQGAALARPGSVVLETLRSGLAVGRRVLRRARVRLAQDSPANHCGSTPDNLERAP